MPDSPNLPEPTSGPPPHETLGTPTEAPAADPAAAEAPAPQPEPSLADTAGLLAERFPALFGAGVAKPIKLRIQADINARAPGVFTKKALSLFLHRHTTRTAYLRALVAEGATRIDLDGQPAGDIAAEHRDAAAVELERRRAIVEAKKQAEREAARASRQDARPPRAARPPRPSQQAEASTSAPQATGERPDARGARPAHPRTSDRPERPAVSRQPGQAQRRPPAGAPQHRGRPGDTGSGAPRPPRHPRPEGERVGAQQQGAVAGPAVPLTPEQAAEVHARQQRALVLRSFEQSPLSKANFAALKGLSEVALDEVLSLAKQERGSR